MKELLDSTPGCQITLTKVGDRYCGVIHINDKVITAGIKTDLDKLWPHLLEKYNKRINEISAEGDNIQG